MPAALPEPAGTSPRVDEASCLAPFDAFFANKSFVEFVKAVASIPDCRADYHFRSQSAFVMTWTGRVGVDFVGRYENLEVDFGNVAQRIGCQRVWVYTAHHPL